MSTNFLPKIISCAEYVGKRPFLGSKNEPPVTRHKINSAPVFKDQLLLYFSFLSFFLGGGLMHTHIPLKKATPRSCSFPSAKRSWENSC